MDCVKAEFGWSDRWARSLMQVAERFANRMLTSDLPSSAQVLALLAASGADDATVQQAADERWTVKQTRQRLGNERQRELVTLPPRPWPLEPVCGSMPSRCV